MSSTTPAVLLARRPRGAFRASDLALAEVELPEVGPGQALVRNLVMSLDPSTRGRMDPGDKQYTENFAVGGPLDGWAIGVVERTRSEALPVGAAVRHRLGWRERAVVGEAAARVVDLSLAPAESWLSCLGQTGFTAFAGLVEVGRLEAGQTVLVSAAAGGVGSMAVQFARLLGAERVVGVAGGPGKCAWLREELGCDATVDHRAGDLDGQIARAVPEGIDLYFDSVGGDHLVAALHRMRIHGRVVLCGMMANFAQAPQPPMNALVEAILRRVTIKGFIVRDHEDLRPEFEKQVAAWLAAGELVDRATVVEGLAAAPSGLEGLLAGANTGKAVVRLGEQ